MKSGGRPARFEATANSIYFYLFRFSLYFSFGFKGNNFCHPNSNLNTDKYLFMSAVDAANKNLLIAVVLLPDVSNWPS